MERSSYRAPDIISSLQCKNNIPLSEKARSSGACRNFRRRLSPNHQRPPQKGPRNRPERPAAKFSKSSSAPRSSNRKKPVLRLPMKTPRTSRPPRNGIRRRGLRIPYPPRSPARQAAVELARVGREDRDAVVAGQTDAQRLLARARRPDHDDELPNTHRRRSRCPRNH